MLERLVWGAESCSLEATFGPAPQDQPLSMLRVDGVVPLLVRGGVVWCELMECLGRPNSNEASWSRTCWSGWLGEDGQWPEDWPDAKGELCAWPGQSGTRMSAEVCLRPRLGPGSVTLARGC